LLIDAGMSPAELRERFANFAVRIRKATRPIARDVETRDVASQLRRSANGAASNHRAAGLARSHREFTSRIAEALTEADEALFWLEHIDAGEMLPGGVAALRNEAQQLVKILARSHETAKAREARDSPRRNRSPRR
jgi:four helix bundle protein